MYTVAVYFLDWLIAVKDDVGIDDLVAVVGADLLASKVLSAAEFGAEVSSRAHLPISAGMLRKYMFPILAFE